MGLTLGHKLLKKKILLTRISFFTRSIFKAFLRFLKICHSNGLTLHHTIESFNGFLTAFEIIMGKGDNDCSQLLEFERVKNLLFKSRFINGQ